MSLPNDLPPPPNTPPPPPPVGKTVPKQNRPLPVVPLSPLKPQAKSRGAAHLARRSPPRTGGQPNVPEQVIRAAEKTDGTTLSQVKQAPASASSSSIIGWKKPERSEKNDSDITPVLGKKRMQLPRDEEDNFAKMLEKTRQSDFSGAHIALQHEEEEERALRNAKEAEIARSRAESVIRELTTSEESFFHGINVMQGFFSVLNRHFNSEKNTFQSQNLKDTEVTYFDQLAKAWGELRDSSRFLIIKLQQIQSRPQVTQRELIQGTLQSFNEKEFEQHCKNLKLLTILHPKTNKLIQKFKNEPYPDSLSKTWILNFEAHTKRQMGDLLILPVQRQPRYMLLVKELAKNLAKIPEYQDLSRVADKLVAELDAMNQEINNSI